MTTPNDGNALTAVRGSKYGPAEVQFACAQELKEVLWKYLDFNPQWLGGSISQPDMRLYCEILEMISTKLSRIATGQINYDDNYRDIVGYATLGMNRSMGLTANGKQVGQ